MKTLALIAVTALLAVGTVHASTADCGTAGPAPSGPHESLVAYRCPFACGATFDNPTDLRHHMFNFHRDGAQPRTPEARKGEVSIDGPGGSTGCPVCGGCKYCRCGI